MHHRLKCICQIAKKNTTALDDAHKAGRQAGRLVRKMSRVVCDCGGHQYIPAASICVVETDGGGTGEACAAPDRMLDKESPGEPVSEATGASGF